MDGQSFTYQTIFLNINTLSFFTIIKEKIFLLPISLAEFYVIIFMLYFLLSFYVIRSKNKFLKFVLLQFY
jgi:hypothetical protein